MKDLLLFFFFLFSNAFLGRDQVHASSLRHPVSSGQEELHDVHLARSELHGDNDGVRKLEDEAEDGVVEEDESDVALQQSTVDQDDTVGTDIRKALLPQVIRDLSLFDELPDVDVAPNDPRQVIPVQQGSPVNEEVEPVKEVKRDPNWNKPVFYAVGDTPYWSSHDRALKDDMDDLPSNAEFVVHVGDIRYAAMGRRYCKRSEFENAADLLKRSHAPVFVLLGDNDWSDCPNRGDGYEYWDDNFRHFESKHWNHTFDIVRQPGWDYNFAFVHKTTLFIGITTPQGWSKIMSSSEMKDQVEWTKDLIRSYMSKTPDDVTGRVVLFGHDDSGTFFDDFEEFVSDELQNRVPILFIQGNDHRWKYQPNFKDQSSLLQIVLEGGREPALEVRVNNTGTASDTGSAFNYDRRDRRRNRNRRR